MDASRIVEFEGSRRFYLSDEIYVEFKKDRIAEACIFFVDETTKKIRSKSCKGYKSICLFTLLDSKEHQASVNDLLKALTKYRSNKYPLEATVRNAIFELKNLFESCGGDRSWIPDADYTSVYRLELPELTGSITNKPPATFRAVTTAKEAVLQSTTFYPHPVFIEDKSREEIFNHIDETFNSGHNAVFICGLGGIGKSEIAKRYAIKKKENDGAFSSVIFAQIDPDRNNQNIEKLINDDTVFVLSNFLNRDERFEQTGQYLSDAEYFQKKFAKIKAITGPETLIIIDNFDVTQDNRLNDLLSGTYRLIITTRTDFSELGSSIPVIPVGEVSSIEAAKDIFFGNLGGKRSDITRDSKNLEELLNLLEFHTLSIELTAKLLRANARLTVDKVIEHLNAHTISEIKTSVCRETNAKTAFEWICGLFDMSFLPTEKLDPQRQLLVFMAAMPTKGIDQALLVKWCEEDLLDAVNELKTRSWLRESYINGRLMLSIHPLIREVVCYQLKPSLQQMPLLLQGILEDENIKIDWLYHSSKEIKQQYSSVFSGLLAMYPDVDLEFFDFYACAQRVCNYCNSYTDKMNPLGLAEKMRDVLSNSSEFNSWRMGYTLYRIGSVFSTLYRNTGLGLKYFLEAEQIMRTSSDTLEKQEWLAILYREIAIAYSRDLFDESVDVHYPNKVKEYADKGTAIASKLAHDTTSLRIKIYPGTLNVWKSKVAAYNGDLDVAEKYIEEAEHTFIENGYKNAVDQTAVLDIKAQIAIARGEYEKAVELLEKSIEKFGNSFLKTTMASIVQRLELAKVCVKAQKTAKAISILNYCKELAEGMYDAKDPIFDKIKKVEDDAVMMNKLALEQETMQSNNRNNRNNN